MAYLEDAVAAMNQAQRIFSAVKTLALPFLVLIIWLLEILYSKDVDKTRSSHAGGLGTTNVYGKTTPISSRSTTLNQLLGNSPNQFGKCKNKPQQKVWIAPYRRFPEMPPEGDSRGLGDYEYLGLLTTDRCANYKINYGAFKNSPADVAFSKASVDGLSKELALARQLGYEWFILDLNKIWLGSDRLIPECERSAHCHVTSDQFVAISMKQPESARHFDRLLTSTTRRLSGNTKDLMGEFLVDRASQWHGIEKQNDGSALAWSISSKIGESLDFDGNKIKSLPVNIDVIILPSPSVNSLSLQLNCADGKKQQLDEISASRSIGSKLRSCQPDSVIIREFTLVDNSVSNSENSSEIPRLGPFDPRLSVFGIMAIEQ